jgi:glutaredoxin
MRTPFFAAIVLGALLCAPGAFAQQLYKSTGPDGRVVYADKRPMEGRLDKTIKVVEQPSSSLEERSSSYVALLQRLRESAAKQAAAPQAPPSQEAVLYFAQWCGYCRQARAFLSSRGIPHREIDIDTKEGLAAFAGAGGGKGIPLLVRGTRRIQGFSAASYEAAFAKPR